MNFYSSRLLPTLIALSMRNTELRPYRERVAGAAEGRVLEVGIGSGGGICSFTLRAWRASSGSVPRRNSWR